MVWPRIASEYLIRTFLDDIFENGDNIIFKFFICFYNFWYLLQNIVWKSASAEIKLVSFKHPSTSYIRVLKISDLSGFIAKNCKKTENLVKVIWILAENSSEKFNHINAKAEIQFMRKIAIKNLFDRRKSSWSRSITISFFLVIITFILLVFR